MTWVRMDDKFPHHPKVMALGALRLAATGLHLEALCYCSEYLTDGIVPAAMVRKFPRKLVDALLSVGLWHRLGDGTVILHDYLDYNPSKEVVTGKRRAARDRMNSARSREQSENFATGSREPANAHTRVPGPYPVPIPERSTNPLTYSTRPGRRGLVDLGSEAG